MQASNAEIRKKAFALYKAHWKKLIQITLIAILPTLIALGIRLTTHSVVLDRIITLIIFVLLYPVSVVGMMSAYLETWRGNPPKIAMMFRFCSSRGLWLKTLVPGLVIQLIALLNQIPNFINMFIPDDSFVKFMLTLIPFVLFIPYMWITIRLILVPYIYGIEYQYKPVREMFADSMRLMKGHVGSNIRLMISVMWWVLLPLILLLISLLMIPLEPDTALYIFVDQNIGNLMLAFVFFAALIMLPAVPYISLAAAGFANNYIPSERDVNMSIKKNHL